MKKEQTTQRTIRGSVNESPIRFITVTAVSIALVSVFTAFINIRLPIAAAGGLIHLGNVPLFISAILFGRKTGAIAGGLGMALFDVLSGWMAWAPFTLVVVGLMGYAVGTITEKKDSYGHIPFSMIVACILKVIGYYAAEGIIYGNRIAPASSIPGNLIQIGVSAIIVLASIKMIKKAAGMVLLP